VNNEAVATNEKKALSKHAFDSVAEQRQLYVELSAIMANPKLRMGDNHKGDVDLAGLEYLFRTAPVSLAEIDREMRYVRVNEKIAHVHGTTVGEDIGRTLKEVIPELIDQNGMA